VPAFVHRCIYWDFIVKARNLKQDFNSLEAHIANEADWQTETNLIRAGTMRSDFGETSEAIYLNSGFVYDSAETAETRFNGEEPGFVYSRYLNPNLEMLAQRLATIEGAEKGVVMASGMAAMFASLMCQLKAGDHVVAHRVLFGSCFHVITQILPNYGIDFTLVDGTDADNIGNALRDNTKLVFIETPANPTLEVIDIAAVAQMTKPKGIRLVVDNIFATPLLQKPLDLGADVIVYSTTKHMDGQGRTLGGAVLGTEEFINEELLPFHRHTGPALSPFNAWIILKGLETFSLRMERHCENAQHLAEFLEAHPKVKRVLYPGLESHPQHALCKQQMKGGGSMIAVEVADKHTAFALMNGLNIVDISNNLGDAKTLITHPASTTHSNMEPEEQQEIGITQGMMRLSVGLENKHDLQRDFEQALAGV